MYYIVLLTLLFFSLSEIGYRRPSKWIFICVYLVMSCMAIFRFGQLGDYFNYYFLYKNPIYTLRDPLYFIYVVIFKLLDIDYTVFVGFTEVIIMGLAFPFFYKTCQRSFIALFVFYCYTFLWCPMGAMRQAVCISMLLCSYTLLVERRMLLFYILVVIGFLFHGSFFAVILIGLFYRKSFYNQRWITYAVLGLTVLALVSVNYLQFLGDTFEDRSFSDGESGSDNLVQVALRFFLIIPVLLYKPAYGTDGYYSKAICIIGYAIYCVLSFDVLVAGRMEYYFRTFMCLLVATIALNERTALRHITLYVFLFVHIILFFKSFNGIIGEKYYKKGVTMFTYPYISVFDKAEFDEYSNVDKRGYPD